MDDLWTPWRGYWEPPSADHEARDVFAHFGVVAYYLQVLEVNVVQHLVGQRLRDSQPGPPTDLDRFFDHGRTKTLGQLLRMLDSGILDSHETDFPEDLRCALNEALNRRNYLTHHFFWDLAHDFMSPQGRQAMIDRLMEERAWLMAVNDRLNDLTITLLEPYGITEEQVDAVMASIARDVEP
jgi:hypothetical protein